MKKSIVVLSMFFGLIIFAQKGNEMEKVNFTIEQQVTIKIKKLNVALDLTKSQENQLYPIVLEQVNKRKLQQEARKARKGTGVKMTNDERYQNIIAGLDAKIALNNKVKSILDENQYEQWKQMQKKHLKKRHSKKRKKGRNKKNSK